MSKETTLENLSDKKLAEKFKKWKEFKKFGESVEAEVKARFKTKGKVTGIQKIVIRTNKVWSDITKLPKNFSKKVTTVKVLSPSEAEKDGKMTGKIKKLVQSVEIYSYIPKG